MKKLRKDNKGFTLVELIVVLVILAILAAILVPALLGYIDEAKQKQIVLHGKSIYTASQTVASKYYAKAKDLTNDTPAKSSSGFAKDVYTIADMADFGDNADAWVSFSGKDKHKGYVVDQIAYTEDGENWIWFDGTSWESGSGSVASASEKVQVNKSKAGN